MFPHLRAIKSQENEDVQPIVVFASRRPSRFNRGWLGGLGEVQRVAPISKAISRLTVTAELSEAMLLTDDHNPSDLIRANEALRWRQRTVEALGKQVLF